MKRVKIREVLLVLFFLWKVVQTHDDEFNIVLAIDENQNDVAIAAQRAINEFKPTALSTVNLKRVFLKSSTNREEACSKVFDSDHKPSLIIDVTRQSTPATDEIRKLSRKLKIPTVSTNAEAHNSWADLSDDEKEILLEFRTPAQIMPIAGLDLATHYNYTKVSVVHDDLFDISELDALLEQSGVQRAIYSLDRKDDIPEFRKILKYLKKQSYENVIVIARTMSMNKFIEAVHLSDMFRLPYKWHFIAKGKGRIRCVSCRHANFKILQPLVSHLHEYEGTKLTPDFNLENKVDIYFYYDLTRLILQAVNNLTISAVWTDKAPVPSCEKLHVEDDELPKSECKILGLRRQVVEELDFFTGKFGEFVVNNEREAQNYQALNVRVFEHRYLYNRFRNRRLGYWDYRPGGGELMFTGALGDDEGGEGEGEGGGEGGEGGSSGPTKLKILVLVHPPYIMKRIPPKNNATGGEPKPVFEGFLIDLFELLKKEIKDFPEYDMEEFINQATEPGKASYGYLVMKKPEGDQQGPVNYADWEEYGGMMGTIKEAISNKGHVLSLGAWTRTADRDRFADFSEPYFELVGLTIMMKKPLRQIFFYKFLNVLEGSVWLCITAAYFFTSILLAIFDRYSPYSYQNNMEKYKDDDEKRIFTFKESLWFCLTSLTPQGGGEAPKSLSGRLVVATWWLFGFIVIASYSANLAAFLTVSRIDNRVRNLKRLSRQYKVRYSAVDGTATDCYFERMAMIEEKFYEIWKDMSLNDSLTEEERAKLAIWDYPITDRFTKIWAQMNEVGRPTSYESAIAKVKGSKTAKEGFALLTDSLTVDYIANTNCDIFKVGDDWSPRPLMLAMTKNSPLKAKIDPLIRKFRDDRTIERLKGKWWDNNTDNKDCEEYRKLADGITLKNSGGTFIVIIGGVCASFFGLAVENNCLKFMILRDYRNLVRGIKKTDKKPKAARKPRRNLFASWKNKKCIIM